MGTLGLVHSGRQLGDEVLDLMPRFLRISSRSVGQPLEGLA